MVVVQKSLLTLADTQTLATIAAKDFITEALRSGDCDSLKKILQREGQNAKLKETTRLMDLAFRHVRGSESEKLTMRKRFVAIRVWNGLSALFFTLNPHDIRSPMTLTLTNHEYLHIESFSLDFDDAATEAYFEQLLQANPRRLHELVYELQALEAYVWGTRTEKFKLPTCICRRQCIQDAAC